MKIATRRELASILEDRMAGAYRHLRDEVRLEYEGNLAKSYLIECEAGRTGTPVFEAFERAVADNAVDFGRGSVVEETDEAQFYYVRLATGRGSAEFHVDATSPRYLYAHSLDVSTVTDAAIDRLVMASGDFDYAWLPLELLVRVASLGSFRGLGLDFDRRDFSDEVVSSPGRPHYLKAQVWTDRGDEVLQVLRERFGTATTLSKVSVQFHVEDPSRHCIDDVKYNGKITTRGESYNAHKALINRLRHDYAGIVGDLERTFLLDVRQGNHGWAQIGGEPLILTFSPPLQDVSAFCDTVFSGGPPFRLCGIPAYRGSGAYVAALDLHSGALLDFEICPSYARVYATRGACGNSLLRLYSNLQQKVTATVGVETNDGRQALQLQR